MPILRHTDRRGQPESAGGGGGRARAAVPLTLELGATAKINNQDSPSSA
jgi:hypothetical protein